MLCLKVAWPLTSLPALCLRKACTLLRHQQDLDLTTSCCCFRGTPVTCTAVSCSAFLWVWCLGGGLRCAGCVLGVKLLTLVGRGVLALTALLACCLCFFWGLALAHKGEAIDFHYLIACDWRGRDRRDCNSEVQMLWSTLVVKQSFCTRSQADVKSVTPFIVVNFTTSRPLGNEICSLTRSSETIWCQPYDLFNITARGRLGLLMKEKV